MTRTSSPASLEPQQVRLLLSGTIMFLFFGLFLAMPDIAYNETWFPGGWHIYTLHVEATQNGIMLWIVALMLPFLAVKNKWLLLVLEASVNVGAWMNVLPWLYGARTGALLRMGKWQRSAPPTSVETPENNEELCANMGLMLMLCALGDILAFGIVLVGLLKNMMSGGKAKQA